ncbi:hypothetical protein BASA50_004132 [Batrachochytrium salamandrivorans]|uniref:TLC domain-containing protein n=1 Tax=Batrachochytrium salamandrivorans TaxID=1357716 RepID=A0ABQ8FGW4_9FUNG|nr:hypothetical protein BASA60_007740 [Batrachochytrium salamandrivorans]KAH6597978.1 hypothetical protein BASA50_004132 [Batrachochytrium salamandrivorans]KAH9249900.1 hypothetical protein BASA81_012391 [Batrachochytrium salamandrivorans]KAH9269987.1 hypothetical protein BASA83_007975 [Batrachochytrium salamandrivorans]KAJ1343734.1 hypothetical protein BSLG_001715 [Batrachochytrium salamandrivorans]
MADSNGRKHQRRPSFDPGVYMLQSEGMPESTSAFRRQLYEHRHRLYRTYEAVVPKSGPVSDEDDQACFLDFIDTVCIDLRISYGVGMYFLHLFICNAMWRRVFYCPPPALDDLVHMHQLEMDAAAMDWWGSSLLSFLLPWKWLWPWPRFSCSTRPFMFVDFSDQIQLAYYLTAFVSYHIYPALDAWLVTFGTHLINGMLCMCFWFGDPTRTAVWMLSGKGPTPTGHYKSWNSLWVPLLMWWMYLLGRRNIMSILSWQQLERLEMQKREHSELDAELAKDKNSANRARDRWHLWFNKDA